MKRLLAALMLIALCSGPALADEIKIEGGGTSIAAIFMPIKSRFENLFGHKLTIVQSSAIKGLIALQEGKVDVATGAHPLEDLIAGAAKAGVRIDASALVATPVEDNRLTVIVHRSNIVKALSKEQLKGIFSGKIGNWKEVGGTDQAINVVWGKDTQGQNMQFTRIVLAGEPITPKVHEATTYRNIFEVVSDLPGAIGVVPSQMSTHVIHTVDTMPIISPMFVITKGAPSEKVQQILKFYKEEYGFLKE